MVGSSVVSTACGAEAGACWAFISQPASGQQRVNDDGQISDQISRLLRRWGRNKHIYKFARKCEGKRMGRSEAVS